MSFIVHFPNSNPVTFTNRNDAWEHIINHAAKHDEYTTPVRSKSYDSRIQAGLHHLIHWNNKKAENKSIGFKELDIYGNYMRTSTVFRDVEGDRLSDAIPRLLGLIHTIIKSSLSEKVKAKKEEIERSKRINDKKNTNSQGMKMAYKSKIYLSVRARIPSTGHPHGRFIGKLEVPPYIRGTELDPNTDTINKTMSLDKFTDWADPYGQLLDWVKDIQNDFGIPDNETFIPSLEELTSRVKDSDSRTRIMAPKAKTNLGPRARHVFSWFDEPEKLDILAYEFAEYRGGKDALDELKAFTEAVAEKLKLIEEEKNREQEVASKIAAAMFDIYTLTGMDMRLKIADLSARDEYDRMVENAANEAASIEEAED